MTLNKHLEKKEVSNLVSNDSKKTNNKKRTSRMEPAKNKEIL